MKVNSSNFQTEVLDSNIPVLLDFGATWCGPCRALIPILNELESQSNGEFKVVKIDIDECCDIASEYSVDAVPTLMLFENGKAVRRHVGLPTKDKLVQFVKG